MAIIPIESDLQKTEDVADFLLFLINENRIKIPKLSLFELIKGKLRPGMSSEILASSITSRFEEIGIPSGPLANGAPNVMENYTKVMSEEIISMIRSDMRVDVAVDSGIVIQASGANAAGPVLAVGSSIAPHTATGLAS